MKEIVITALLGKERNNIEGFVNYHSPWVKRFEFVYNESDEESISFCQNNKKCNLTKTDYSCATQENLSRNLLQEKVDFSKETGLMLDLDERLDLRTLSDLTTEHLINDITVGIINNCDNYFLIDAYPRQIFSNQKLTYVHHTHSWALTKGLVVGYLVFPKVNHLIQKPFKKSGFETENDIITNPNKFLDKKLVRLYMEKKFSDVVLEYEKYRNKLEPLRSAFMCYMVAVLACEKSNLKPHFEELSFFDEIPTKTEVAINYIRAQLLGEKEYRADLSLFKNNCFGITSSYAQQVAINRGAHEDNTFHMWRP